MLIFPEGTRSPERGLGHFRPGAFELAARAEVPIVPLFVTCEPPTLMRGQRWYEIPERTATLTVTQLPTIRPPFDARETRPRAPIRVPRAAEGAPAPAAPSAPSRASRPRFTCSQ